MRWQNLLTDQSEQQALPGYRDPAVVRRFEAPEALDMRFYEVHAKSALNRVPGGSPMPFRWTVNPYRGCSHACVYCLAGDTDVLLADGRTRALADLQVGDAIVGTTGRGRYRRYAPTEVLAKWSSIKPAWAVTLEDGTELVASGEHRFLSDRGWSHVIPDDDRRPHLRPRSRLLGPGGQATAPLHDDEYRRGYLCAAMQNPGGPDDDESLDRALGFLTDLHPAPGVYVSGDSSARPRPEAVIRASALAAIVEWPVLPTLPWIKGFLAGVFDLHGSWDGDRLRIDAADPNVADWALVCLERCGYDAIRDDATGEIDVRGGHTEHMRLMLSADPAVTAKRSIEGRPVTTSPELTIASIRPLGMVMRMYDITTGTGDFIANGVVSHNCFARPTHTYLGFGAGRDFERQIVVKVNAPEVLRRELSRPSWTGEHVALGTNTDPYQWVEGRYKLMPGIWEAFRDTDTECSVLTKSPLLLRDLPLLRELAQAGLLTAALSVPTLEERAWRATEPHTPHPRARLEAVAELNRNGIPTSVLVAPLMPGINDDPQQVRRIVELAHEAGAVNITPIALHLRPGVREVFLEWLEAERPDLLERYGDLYARSANAPRAERERLQHLVRDVTPPRPRGQRRFGQNLRRAREPAPHAPSPRLRQETLF